MSTYTDAIRSDADRLSAAVRVGDLATPIAACPGWNLQTLVAHTGFIHRWATVALLTGAAPTKGAVSEPGDDENLAVWIVEGAVKLIEALESTDPDAETWHPFTLEQKAWVWARRQAMETVVHRWDAEFAVHGEASIDAALASEGIHEYFELGLPRVLKRDGVTAPTSSLHVHCTDVDGEWLIWADNGEYRMLPIHDKGDAALRGPAADIWLVLMGRADRSTLDIVGDAAAADAWLDLPGW